MALGSSSTINLEQQFQRCDGKLYSDNKYKLSLFPKLLQYIDRSGKNYITVLLDISMPV